MARYVPPADALKRRLGLLNICNNCSPLPLAIVTLKLAKILWTLICRHRRIPQHPPLFASALVGVCHAHRTLRLWSRL